MGEAPMTVCLVIEFSNLPAIWSSGWYETLQASYGFLETLKPEDYVAVVAYDLRSEILSDFSTDKRKAYEAMQRLRIAAYSESNLYDALTDTADRMSTIRGPKSHRRHRQRRRYLLEADLRQDPQIASAERGAHTTPSASCRRSRSWMDARGLMGASRAARLPPGR
jgi:hypothetical protein